MIKQQAATRLDSFKPMIQLSGVSKRIRGRDIVKDLSMQIFAGEVFGLLGPNGAGKTTTIRMMVGLIALSAGEIKMNGFSIQKEKKQALKHVGVIVENPEMYKYMSGYNNLLHFARMIPGISKQRIDEVVALVGLSQRIHDKVKTYSLGMRQRLGVAQALLHKPAVLILDEPTNGLDPAGIRELRDYLKRLAHQEGTAVVVSSHMLSEMELMCDRVAIIQDGALIEIQTVTGQKEDDELMRIVFEVDRPAFAAEQVAELSAGDAPEIHANGFTVEALRESIPLMASRLALSGVKVYAIERKQKSLEEKFLEATRGNIQDAAVVSYPQ